MRLLGLEQPGPARPGEEMWTPYGKRSCSDCTSPSPGKAKFLRYEKLTGEEKDATFMKW